MRSTLPILFLLTLAACTNRCGGKATGPTADASVSPDSASTLDSSQAADDNRKGPAQIDAGTSTILDIGAGWNHVCILQASGRVSCWGANAEGALGLSAKTKHEQSPTLVPNIMATSLVVGSRITCARTTDGSPKTKCWGDFDHQFGVPTPKRECTPHCPHAPTEIKIANTNIAAAMNLGWTHSCVIDETGDSVTCWGGPFVERHRELPDYNKPLVMTGFAAKVVQLTSGDAHVCALLANGTVACFGADDHGQLGADGIGGAKENSLPIAPAAKGLRDITAISAGRNHTCALSKNGHVFCWGHDYRGQLGTGEPSKLLCHARLGDTPCSTVPLEAKGITNAVEIRAGVDHTCARLASGKVVCWGDNAQSEIGGATHDECPLFGTIRKDGKEDIIKEKFVSCARSPVPVEGIDNAVRLTAGHQFTCVLLATNELACWGNNSDGALGMPSSETCTPEMSLPIPCSTRPVRFTVSPTSEQIRPKIKRPPGEFAWDEPKATLRGKLIQREVLDVFTGRNFKTSFLILDSPITVYDGDAGLDSTSWGTFGPEKEVWFVNRSKKPTPDDAFDHRVTITGELNPSLTGHHHAKIWIAGEIVSVDN